MKSRNDLVKFLSKKIRSTIGKTNKQRELIKELYNEFDIPMGLSSDYITMRVDIDSATDFILFVFLKKIDEKKLNLYFNDSEIEKYGSSKFVEKNCLFR